MTVRCGVLYDRLRQRAGHEPAAPFVTWYGPARARVELSTITFATSVAKTAGMLLDDLDAEPGWRLRLELPLHWQVPVWVAAADVAGLEVVWDDGPQVDVTVVPDETHAMATAGLVVISAATPFGRPEHPVPAPLVDHFAVAMGQPDVYLHPTRSGSWVVGGEPWHAAGLEAAARDLVDTCAIAAGASVLVGPSTPLLRAALACWAVPLLTGGASVIVQSGDSTDLDAIAAAEHLTARV